MRGSNIVAGSNGTERAILPRRALPACIEKRSTTPLIHGCIRPYSKPFGE